MSQAESLASHWVLLFFLGLLNNYMLVWSAEYASVRQFPTRQDYIHRTWSEWTTWSACSRTCGGGVKMRTRVCKISTLYGVTPHPNSCIGETVEYELCSVHNCSPYDKEFLEYQCSLRDGQIVKSRKVEEWIPYRYGKNPCELQCWSKDRSIVYSFGKVIDGTKCATQDPIQPALCINGRCTPVDCAGQIGSDNKLDRCGVCRGNNSTCIHYKDIFWGRPRIRTPFDESKDHHYDYEKITTIPAGVTEVIVRENSETNFIALMDHKGSFLINGNWRIQSPGRILIHGSEFMYNRTWDGKESLFTQGPIRFEVHIYVLGSGDIPSVNFEYWISSNTPLKAIQPFPILNQIKHPETKSNLSKYSQPESNHIHDVPPTMKHLIPVTQFQGYKSYYHRNEILKSVPSWSIKRHRTHKNNLNRYLHAQNDISSSTVKNSVELNTIITPSNYVPSSSKNKLDIGTMETDVLGKRKNIYSSKVNSFQTSTRKYPSSSQQDISLHQVESSQRNVTVKPIYRYKGYDINQRNEMNTVSPLRRSKFENYGRHVDEYGRSTTVLALTGENQYYHQDTLVTLQPNLLRKTPKTDRRNKGGRRRQKSVKHENSFKDEKRTHNKKKRKSENDKDDCQPCPKPQHQKKNVCTSEFVLRATVLSIEKQDDSYRYELEINQSFKNRVPISPREYIWTNELCRCPKLRIGKEYIIMGYSGSSGNRRESRLLVDRNSFVRKYSHKRARTVQKIVRDQGRICKKFE